MLTLVTESEGGDVLGVNRCRPGRLIRADYNVLPCLVLVTSELQRNRASRRDANFRSYLVLVFRRHLIGCTF